MHGWILKLRVLASQIIHTKNYLQLVCLESTWVSVTVIAPTQVQENTHGWMTLLNVRMVQWESPNLSVP